jgi:glycosyltransferase involved in cell wall biosynthesis
VVVPNGRDRDEITSYLHSLNDPRVHIFPSDLEGIGALKRYACTQAQGDMLIELDHDDRLLPDCLATLIEWHDNHKAGFYYSDSINADDGGTSEIFAPGNGWDYYRHRFENKDYLIPRSFEIGPRSLGEIFFAPNHVRAWVTESYWNAGGHDASIPIADDHDLLCRTYLAGINMVYIPKVLYFYRRHPDSHCLTDNVRVQEFQLANFNRYMHPLIFEWCKREELKMIDLGGLHNCPREQGFEALDYRGRVEYPYDFFDEKLDKVLKDGSVGCFRAVDFLEHISPMNGSANHNVVTFMNRIYQKLADRGWLISATPAVSDRDGKIGRGAFQDPTHVSFWSPNNFWYFTNREHAKYVPEISCRFQEVRIWVEYPDDWHRQVHIPYLFADVMAVKSDKLVPGGMLI